MRDFDTLAQKLLTASPTSLPRRADVIEFAALLSGILFPHLAERRARTQILLRDDLALSWKLLHDILEVCPGDHENAANLADRFFTFLPELRDRLRLDAEAIEQGDPAARSMDEVILTYPGFLAILLQRVAHEFYSWKVDLFPRMITEYAHERTGIDIHPGAVIGASFCIDHGTGIVIGESAVIGNHVKMYQGVTLGALSVKKEGCCTKRHPTIGDHVVLYSGATILGGTTIIGERSVIGGNVWITESVAANSVVYHQPEQTTTIRS